MKDNYKYGWVGLYRSINTHWIYPHDRPFTKYEAWVDLILMVNHSEKDVFSGEDLVKCKRGETITSQKKLMLRWSWSKSKLIKFLEVLKKDSMLTYKSDSKKTTIKLVNFIDYQDFEEIEKLKKDHRKTVESLQKDLKKLSERLQKATNNNGKEENNTNTIIERVKEFEIQILSTNNKLKILSPIEIKKFLSYWTEYGDRARKFRREKEDTWNTKARLERWKNNNYGKNNSNNEPVKAEVRDYNQTPDEALAEIKAEQEEARRG